MKKVIGIAFALVLMVVLVTGCGTNEPKSSVSEVKVTLPNSTGSNAIVEGEAVLATQSYLLSRSYFEKLETYDLDSFNAQEYRELLAKTTESFRISEALCNSFERHARTLAQVEEKGDRQQEQASYELVTASADVSQSFPFASVAYAAEDDSPAVKFAEELTKTFDNAKNGQKLKAVAEKYGTDVKKAKAMLDQAQAVLEGTAYADQAEFENKCYELAVETKAAASTIGFGVACAGVIASGGIAAGGLSAAGLFEAGGVAFGGVSAVIDTGTAVTIHATNGEGDDYTAAWEKTSQVFAPATAIFAIGGGVQNIKDFRNPEKAAEAVNNAAQAFLVGLGLARDYVQDGTVLGVSAEVVDGYREIIVRSAETSDPEAAREVLYQTGISQETMDGADSSSSATVTSADKPNDGLLGAEADTYIQALGGLADPNDPIDIDAFLTEVDESFQACLVSEGVQPSSTDKAEGSDAEKADESTESKDEGPEVAGPLPAARVVGTYSFPGADDVWTLVFSEADSGHLVATDVADGTEVVGTYDEITGVFFISEGSMSVKVTFKKAGNGIKADLIMTLGEETAASSAMRE